MAEDFPMSIRAFAERHGVTHRTLRHYEGLELLRPDRRTGGGTRYRRSYSSVCDRQMSAIMAYRAAGVSLDRIRLLIEERGDDAYLTPREVHDLVSEQMDEIRRLQQNMQAAHGLQRSAEQSDANR